MAAKSSPAAKNEAFAGPAILVTCMQPGGRRRAGYQFGSEAVRIELADLSEEQAELLASDPFLSIKGEKPEAPVKTE